jgi:group I intron endonuclease
MRTWYIYKITNLLNGKSYVGQRLLKSNKEPLTDNYMGSGLYLKKSIKKHGLQNFRKEILIESLTTQFAANIFEEYFIKKEETLNPFGYNLLPSSIQLGGRVGIKTSDKTKEKLSEALKGKPGNFKGKHHSQKTKKKMSKDKTGSKNPNYGNLGTFTGKHHSEKTKEKLSLKNKGKKTSKKTKKKQRLARLGKHHSEETKQKIRESKIGSKNPNYGNSKASAHLNSSSNCGSSNCG